MSTNWAAEADKVVERVGQGVSLTELWRFGGHHSPLFDNVPTGNRCLTLFRAIYGPNPYNPDPTIGLPPTIAELCKDERIPAGIEVYETLRGEELRTKLQPFVEWRERLDSEVEDGTLDISKMSL